jgi:nicotinate-nucleotide pyrophosphorylase (carboxylating)
MMEEASLDAIVRHALTEDLCEDFQGGFRALLAGDSISFYDVTSDALFTDEVADAQVYAKSEGVLSGSKAFLKVFSIVDTSLTVSFSIQDGQRFTAGDVVATLHGRVHSMLIGERTALNFLGHLSGIATRVRELTEFLNSNRIRILDTRKTLPGLRSAEKEAVVHGGGMNHRMGLYDMVLIKDNHIDRTGSITQAVQAVRSRHGRRYRIEVETRTLAEVEEALQAGADRIMLDNMDLPAIQMAGSLAKGRAEIEVSGNIDRLKLASLRTLPIDFISMGSITNAAGHADFSLTVQ